MRLLRTNTMPDIEGDGVVGVVEGAEVACCLAFMSLLYAYCVFRCVAFTAASIAVKTVCCNRITAAVKDANGSQEAKKPFSRSQKHCQYMYSHTIYVHIHAAYT